MDNEILKPLTFKEKFSCTVDFVRACWRPLLRILSVVLVPLCLIQALCEDVFVNTVSTHVVKEDVILFFINMAWTMMMALLVDLYTMLVVYGMMNLYHSKDAEAADIRQDINGLAFNMFWTSSYVPVRAVGKIVAAMVALCVTLVVVSFAIGMFAGMLPLADGNEKALAVVGVLFAVLLVLVIPLCVLVVPAYALDRLDFLAGFKKAVLYGFLTWRGVVAVMTVYLFAGVVAVLPFCMIPGKVGSFVCIYVGYLVHAAALVTLGYQYWHAKAKIVNE